MTKKHLIVALKATTTIESMPSLLQQQVIIEMSKYLLKNAFHQKWIIIL